MYYLGESGLRYLVKKIVARIVALENAVKALSAKGIDSGDDA